MLTARRVCTIYGCLSLPSVQLELFAPDAPQGHYFEDFAQLADMTDDDRNERVHEQLEKRTASGETERVSTHGQLREFRRELNALVSIAHRRTGKPHGWIHDELRRVCGGPPVAAATTDQLKARIDAVREL